MTLSENHSWCQKKIIIKKKTVYNIGSCGQFNSICCKFRNIPATNHSLLHSVLEIPGKTLYVCTCMELEGKKNVQKSV